MGYSILNCLIVSYNYNGSASIGLAKRARFARNNNNPCSELNCLDAGNDNIIISVREFFQAFGRQRP